MTVDAHKSTLTDGSFICIPYSFFIRDNRLLPTSFLREHDEIRLSSRHIDDFVDDFPLKHVLHDDDISSYMSRWVEERWDPDAPERTTIKHNDRLGHAVSRGKHKRRISGVVEGQQRSRNTEHHHRRERVATHDDDNDEEAEVDSESQEDTELDLETVEAVEVQNILRAFSAAEMMP